MNLQFKLIHRLEVNTPTKYVNASKGVTGAEKAGHLCTNFKERTYFKQRTSFFQKIRHFAPKFEQMPESAKSGEIREIGYKRQFMINMNRVKMSR